MAAKSKQKKQLARDQNVGTLQFQHNSVNYIVRLSPNGIMGYVDYHCTAENGAYVCAGGISRLNYDTQRRHLNAIKKVCLKAAEQGGLDEWDMIRYPSLTEEQNARIRLARRMGFALMVPAVPNAEAQDKRTLELAESFLVLQRSGIATLNEKIADALSKGGR